MSSKFDKFDSIIREGNGPYRREFEELLRQGDPLPVGVPFLDEFLEGGMHPGVLNVIAGRTGHGKTLLTRTMIQRNHDRRILYLHADEDRSSVMFDLAASVLKRRTFDLKREFKHPMSQYTPKSLETTVMDRFPQLHIPNTDLLGASIDDVASVVDQAERMWGAPAELIVFDYIGCLEIEGGDSNVSGLVHMREHKRLCRQFKKSVWCLISQLRRPSSTRPSAPDLNELFGGGEAAIDGCAIGVWRFSDRTHEDNEILFNIMKAKQGRAYLGGPVSKEKALKQWNNLSLCPHVHRIGEASTVAMKPWPLVQEMMHPMEGDFDGQAE